MFFPPLHIGWPQLSQATHPPAPENATPSSSQPVISGPSFGHCQTGGRSPHPGLRTIHLCPPCSPTSPCPASRQAPRKRMLSREALARLHLAGPRRLYLESGRGRKEARWQLPARAGVRDRQAREPGTQPDALLSRWFPAPPASRAEQSERLSGSLSHCHAQAAQCSRGQPPTDHSRGHSCIEKIKACQAT